MSPMVASIIVTVVMVIILTIINVYSALKHPEKYQKMSDEANKKIDEIKTSVTNNVSWEDAKRQAAIEIEIEEKIKAEKKAAKQAAKQAAKIAKQNKGK